MTEKLIMEDTPIPFSPDNIPDTGFIKAGKEDQKTEIQDIPEDKSEKVFESKTAIKICPHCGMNTDTSPFDEPTENDKQEWIRHIMGKNRFCKEYSLYGGKLKIAFKTRTVKENSEVYKYIRNQVNENKISDAPASVNPALMYYTTRANIVYSLDSLVVEGKAVDLIDSDNFSLMENDLEEYLGAFSQAQIELIVNYLVKFEELCKTLIRRAINPDFF